MFHLMFASFASLHVSSPSFILLPSPISGSVLWLWFPKRGWLSVCQFDLLIIPSTYNTIGLSTIPEHYLHHNFTLKLKNGLYKTEVTLICN